MIPDNLLINLKIMSKIQKNGRIARSYDGIISLETDTYIQPIRRFLCSDSRKQAIFEINSIVNESVATLNVILNSKFMNKNFCQSDEYLKNCENIHLLISEMEQARNGIENLKFTYQNDHNTASQLDIIILKINTTIKDVSQKLFYYQSFIPGTNFNSDYHYNTSQIQTRVNTDTTPLESIQIDRNELSPDFDINMRNLESQIDES